jgi:hypothetical protein
MGAAKLPSRLFRVNRYPASTDFTAGKSVAHSPEKKRSEITDLQKSVVESPGFEEA